MQFIPTKWMIPTHNRLRNPLIIPKLLDVNSEVHHMAFYEPSEPIKVIRIKGTSDIFVNNGHHRLVAADLLWGAFPMKDIVWEEYALDEFLEINVKVGWVTPYNPYLKCRKENFADWKKWVITHLTNLYPVSEHNVIAKRWVETGNCYSEPRKICTLGEMYVETT